MKFQWRYVIVATLAVLVAVSFLYPACKWWAMWGLLLVGLGMVHERHVTRLQTEAEAGYEDSPSGVGTFVVICFLVFLLGTAWALINGLGLWATGAGLASMAVYALSLLASFVATDQAKQNTVTYQSIHE